MHTSWQHPWGLVNCSTPITLCLTLLCSNALINIIVVPVVYGLIILQFKLARMGLVSAVNLLACYDFTVYKPDTALCRLIEEFLLFHMIIIYFLFHIHAVSFPIQTCCHGPI